MSTRLKEKEERISRALDSLAQESSSGIPIIVEGRKDAATLRILDVEGTIIEAKTGGKTMLDLLSELERRRPQEVILLLDFDRHGREWTRQLKSHLEAIQVKPNLTFWKTLRKLVGHDVRDIESLTSYIETLRRKSSGSRRLSSS